MTSAQSGLRVPDPQAYCEKRFDLLAGRDPIEVLGQTASRLGQNCVQHIRRKSYVNAETAR
jgi:hypothetical protein